MSYKVYLTCGTIKKSHFRHEKGFSCDLESIYVDGLNNSNNLNNLNTFYKDTYLNPFYEKWTSNIIKPNYLFHYWNNAKIADIIQKHNHIDNVFVIRHNLISVKNYMADQNVIWILDGKKRSDKLSSCILYKVIYEDNSISYYYKSGSFDYDYIGENHQVYLDMGKNQLLKIYHKSYILNKYGRFYRKYFLYNSL